MCLFALEDYREWAERLSSPALLPLSRQGFAMLSKQRGRISYWLGLASEHEIVEALGRVAAPACEIPSSPFEGRVERLAFLAKQVNRDVERRVSPAVREERAVGVLDQHAGPLGDPVHPADPG